MKYLNNIKSSLLVATIVCVGSVFTSCEDDITMNTTDLSKLETVDGTYGYVRSVAGARELTPITIFGDATGNGHLFFELSKSAEQNINVTFKIDEAALTAYNAKHGTSYEMYPANKLTLENAGSTIVKAGEKKSESVTLNIGAGGTVGKTYAVAISATASDGVTLSTNNESYIYLINPLPAIPNSKKGDVRTLCFVEVNDENILNCGEYTMANSGKPFFDVVSIFAANINIDSETGRACVFCNDQVSYVLKNADKIIRPLQAKGIKVNLSILGNHYEAGVANLSQEAAKDFAKELKAYVDIYGLDGIDFDDEYTNYSDNPSPGFEVRSSENYLRLIEECRKIMPDKLLGIYEYQGYDAPNGTTAEGKTAGDLVDYMCYGTYQRYVKDREQQFSGMTPAKYGPYSLKINEEYNGGWVNFDEATIQDLKDAGYGLQVFYNPKPRTYSYDKYFTAVSKILFNEEVEWSGNYYNREETVAPQGRKTTYESELGEWEVTSSNSLYYYTPGPWWDWGGSQTFNIRIEAKENGKSYYIYGWGSYPEITNKYPLIAEYNGTLSITAPQIIHEGDTEDPINWEMRWGTYGKGDSWSIKEDINSIRGIYQVNGNISLSGIGDRYGIDPCYKEGENYVLPGEVKYHITANYTLVKK